MQMKRTHNDKQRQLLHISSAAERTPGDQSPVGVRDPWSPRAASRDLRAGAIPMLHYKTVANTLYSTCLQNFYLALMPCL